MRVFDKLGRRLTQCAITDQPALRREVIKRVAAPQEPDPNAAVFICAIRAVDD